MSTASKTPQPLDSPARERGGSGWVDPTNVRSGADALQGHFCRITKGEHAGIFGVYVDNAEFDADIHRPITIVVERRGDPRQGERFVVPYEDVERADTPS